MSNISNLKLFQVQFSFGRYWIILAPSETELKKVLDTRVFKDYYTITKLLPMTLDEIPVFGKEK